MTLIQSHQKQICRYLMLFLTLAVILFIFSNSAKDSRQSGAQSDKVVDAVRPPAETLLPIIDIEPSHTNISSIVRTMGHFLEFALLGIAAYVTARLWFDNRLWRLAAPFGLCAVTAFADETIQLASPGRAWQLQDILVDCAGAACGILCACICVVIVCLSVRRKEGQP